MLVGNNSSVPVADSENIYKDLIIRLTGDRIETNLFTTLDLDIAGVYQKNWLDFDTLLPLYHSKAQNHPWPGAYLQVVYDESHHGLFWLYVDAAMNVENRIAQHYKFRYNP